MKRGQAFTPDGPLTLGDIRVIARDAQGDDSQIVDVFTPMSNRKQVTLTVTTDRWEPPNLAAPQQDNTEGDQQQHG